MSLQDKLKLIFLLLQSLNISFNGLSLFLELFSFNNKAVCVINSPLPTFCCC